MRSPWRWPSATARGFRSSTAFSYLSAYGGTPLQSSRPPRGSQPLRHRGSRAMNPGYLLSPAICVCSASLRVSASSVSLRYLFPLFASQSSTVGFQLQARLARGRNAAVARPKLLCVRLKPAAARGARLPERGTSGSVQRGPANPARPGREQRYRDCLGCRRSPEVPRIVRSSQFSASRIM